MVQGFAQVDCAGVWWRCTDLYSRAVTDSTPMLVGFKVLDPLLVWGLSVMLEA